MSNARHALAVVLAERALELHNTNKPTQAMMCIRKIIGLLKDEKASSLDGTTMENPNE